MMAEKQDFPQLDGGVRHITSNFSMFGFNAELALFQSVKELVENSLDAADSESCEINLNIKAHQDKIELCTLEVLDNGSGILDIPRALGCFSTSKVSTENFTAGQFGRNAVFLALFFLLDSSLFDILLL
jgi:DNA topoisomerase VI subunit B